MSIDNKLLENDDSVKNKIEYDERMRVIREQVLKRFDDYRTTLNYMAADAPITILCLPTPIETALLNHGCLRIYDIFNIDFTKIKGLGEIRIRQLTSRLDEFFAML
jgi:hypothetical protein